MTRGVTMATALITTIIALRNKIKLSFDREAFSKSLLASTVMAIAVAAIQTYHYSKYLLPAYVFTGGAIYLAVLRLANTIKRSDIELMKEYLGPRFSFLSKLLDKLVANPQ